MKPAWDKLIGAFEGSTTSLVADVDCTEAGKDLCEKHGVQGFPTIKYGDPNDLQDYQGGRDYESLKAFADENLGPTCGPANLDLCSAGLKKKIEGYMTMSAESLEAKVSKAKTAVEVDVPLMQKALAHLKSEM
mmetsp:Transcript_38843/g.87300  ORF Transcript_38843/g.87300 Transcript_38843/m.87300 type:complete len:133 (+) Transcript_38843:212-610(+)